MATVAIHVECWAGAGGGAGGNTGNKGGGGGGGGGYAYKAFTATSGTGYALVAGHGGAAVSGLTPGNNGTHSYFINTSTVYAEAGDGGIDPGSGGSGGAGGGLLAGQIGDVVNRGGDGGAGTSGAGTGASGGGGGGGAYGGHGGDAGSPTAGGAGTNTSPGTAEAGAGAAGTASSGGIVNGATGSNYGGGGAGGHGSANGGKGGDGLTMVSAPIGNIVSATGGTHFQSGGRDYWYVTNGSATWTPTVATPNTPTLLTPASSSLGIALNAALAFTTTDPNSNIVSYEIQVDLNNSFNSQSGSPLIDATSPSGGHDAGQFLDVTNPADTDPFASGDTLKFTVPNTETLALNTVYYWQVRAKNSTGTYSSWSSINSFTTENGNGDIPLYTLTMSLNPKLSPFDFIVAYSTLNSTTPGVQEFFTSLTATLSFTGAMTKQTNLTDSNFQASLSFAGNLVKMACIWLYAGVSFSGAFVKAILRSLIGSLSFTGAITRSTQRSLSASLSFAGSLTKTLLRAFVAVLSFSGSIASVFISGNFTQALNATLSFTGNMTKQTSSLLAASLSFSGNFTKSIYKTFVGTLTFTGAYIKLVNKSLAASISFSGNLSRQSYYALAATLTFTGTTARSIAKTGFNATLSFSGIIAKTAQKSLQATISFAGKISRIIYASLSGGISFVGSLGSQLLGTFFVAFTASLNFSGNLTKSTARTLTTATLGFTGAMFKRPLKMFIASIYFVGNFLSRYLKFVPHRGDPTQLDENKNTIYLDIEE